MQVSPAKVGPSLLRNGTRTAGGTWVTELCIHIAHIPVKSWDLNLFKDRLYTQTFKKKHANELFKARI